MYGLLILIITLLGESRQVASSVNFLQDLQAELLSAALRQVPMEICGLPNPTSLLSGGLLRAEQLPSIQMELQPVHHHATLLPVLTAIFGSPNSAEVA